MEALLATLALYFGGPILLLSAGVMGFGVLWVTVRVLSGPRRGDHSVVLDTNWETQRGRRATSISKFDRKN